MLSPLPVFAQSVSGDVQWTKILSPARDLSASIPSGFLLDNESSVLRLFSRRDGASITLMIYKDGDPKQRLDLRRNFSRDQEGKVSRFKIGNFEGDVSTRDNESFGMTVYIASNKAYYTLTVSAETSKHPILTRFLDSVRLGGLPLTKQDNPADDPGPATVLSDLKTSPEILEALKKTNPGEIKIEHNYKEEPKPAQDRPNGTAVIRPLTILRKRQAGYTASARSAQVSGTVRLNVLFKAEGYIGEIRVIDKLSKGLTESAIKAAKQVKFLPKVVDGKPVDVSATMEYGFNIY
jgi:TonB family protein